MTLPRSITSLMVSVIFVACGGDGTGPDNNGGGNVREVLANPSFSTDINEIFERTGCTAGGCHGTGGAGAAQTGLVLVTGSAANHGQLVNQASTQQPNLLRVEPNDPANSYLMIKLMASPPTGLRMPRNGAPLDNIDMSNLTNWINNGAPNN